MERLIPSLKKRVALLTVICMVFALLPMNSSAATKGASDISGHWAEDTIQSWMDQGTIKGYEDGTFKPENNISRAEFMTLVNGAFKYTEMTNATFSDVKADSWYANEIAKASKADYISGYPDGTMRPQSPINREEAASILMKINKLSGNDDGAKNFTDVIKMKWSKGAIGAVAANDIMRGYPTGDFKPQNFLKRAEALIAIQKAVSYFASLPTIEPEIIPGAPTAPVSPGGGGGGIGGGGTTPVLVQVSEITVTGANGETVIVKGSTLQMSADVSPLNAAKKTVTWSVEAGTGSATISADGLLTSLTSGTVTVEATAEDGSLIQGTKIIEVADVIISNIEELTAAIHNQAENQTWIIKAGNYGLKTINDYLVRGQEGWYFPIISDNITIKGIGNPTLYGNEYTTNGNWSTQNLITIFGKNVKISGFTLMTKVEGNKTIEVVGADSTIEDCIIKPNTIVDESMYNNMTNANDREFSKQWGGSLYYSSAGNHVVKNVTINNAGISFRYSPAGTHINFENVNIIHNTNIDDINTYRYSSGFNNATCTITGKPMVTYLVDTAKDNLVSATSASKDGDKIILAAGTYYVPRGWTPPTGVILDQSSGAIIKEVDVIISNVNELKTAINTQVENQTWIIKAGTYNLDKEQKFNAQGVEETWYFPIYKSNITIKGIENPIITSTTFSANGAWASQNFITVFGDNVTIDGLKIKCKEETNKAIEICGKNFTLKNVDLIANEINKTVGDETAGQWFSGSIYFNPCTPNASGSPTMNSNVGTALLENVNLSAWISVPSSITEGTVRLKNVENNFRNNFYADYKWEGVRYEYGVISKNNVIISEEFRVLVDNKAFNLQKNILDRMPANSTVEFAAGTYELTEQLNITKALTLSGNGGVILKAKNDAWSTTNGLKHLLAIYAGTAGNPVTISNIVIDANTKCHAVNTYDNAYVILNDVTIQNSKGAALTVNGSYATANNLKTSGNAWGAVNVDPGSGVITPSTFTLTGNSELAENNQIWSDGAYVTGTATVMVISTGYVDKTYGTTGHIWTNRI